MVEDFPAAHSMDSTWFAVDRDGHVAVFSTGEAGALPEDCTVGGDSAHELLELLPSFAKGGSAIHEHEGRSLPGAAPEHWFAPRENGYLPAFGGIFFLRALEPYEAELKALTAVLVPSRSGRTVVIADGVAGTRDAPNDVYRRFCARIHESQDCLSCGFHGQSSEVEGASGVYSYSHLTENWISGPYGRQQSPSKPLKVEDLPAKLRESLEGFRYEDLCFAEKPHLQPFEHGPCLNYDGNEHYMKVDGSIVGEDPSAEDE